MVAASRGDGYCPQCLKKTRMEIELFSGSMIIAVDLYASWSRNTKNTPNLLSVPEKLTLRDATYVLSGCIYGDGSHFVSIVRDFTSNRLFYCDGMTNNATFVDYKGSKENNFPMKHSTKRLAKSYFVRSEYTYSTINNNR